MSTSVSHEAPSLKHDPFWQCLDEIWCETGFLYGKLIRVQAGRKPLFRTTSELVGTLHGRLRSQTSELPKEQPKELDSEFQEYVAKGRQASQVSCLFRGVTSKELQILSDFPKQSTELLSVWSLISQTRWSNIKAPQLGWD